MPSVSALFIMGSIIAVFSFHVANEPNKPLDSLDYGYLTAVFAIMYLLNGFHQMFYMNMPLYGARVDIDKLYIVLGFTTKVVLAWTYIAIRRQIWNELGESVDDKVPWEDGEFSLETWNSVKIGLLVGAGVFIVLAYTWYGKPNVHVKLLISSIKSQGISNGRAVKQPQWKERSRRRIVLNF